MLGQMMNVPLTITALIRHAQLNHASTPIVSVTADNPRHRTTMGAALKRSAQLANALKVAGVKTGDRVGTLAWNDYRHFEAYFAVSGMGAVLHTINPRLFPEQIAFIANHAEDRILLIDPMFIPLVAAVREQLPNVEKVIVLAPTGADLDAGLINYEDFIADHSQQYDWPELDENSASSICYTSGTTGNPKGVVYSHRSTILHAMASTAADAMCLSVRDAVLPVVPMFHVNAWGIPYAAAMVGCKLVFPGPKMGDGETLQDLIETEQVTLAAGVPTVWLGLLQYLEKSGKDLKSLERTIVGGSACPISTMKAFRDKYGVETLHAWGMTEMSPIGTLNVLKREADDLPEADYWKLKAKQGRAIFGVEMKIVDDNNQEQPWDGIAVGSLKVRGPWICSEYYKLPGNDAHDADGWFATGDVASIDPEGFMQITDRTKDVIKSGGEWISSIELENAAMGHPGIAEAAVIGIAHPKWDERPLLIVVPNGTPPEKDDVLNFLSDKVAKWWLPDDIVVIDELPKTATGKVQKLALREQFSGFSFNT